MKFRYKGKIYREVNADQYWYKLEAALKKAGVEYETIEVEEGGVGYCDALICQYLLVGDLAYWTTYVQEGVYADGDGSDWGYASIEEIK